MLSFQNAIIGLTEFVCNVLPISKQTVKPIIKGFIRDGLIVIEDNKIAYLPIDNVVSVTEPQTVLTFASVIDFLDKTVLTKEEKTLIFSKLIEK